MLALPEAPNTENVTELVVLDMTCADAPPASAAWIGVIVMLQQLFGNAIGKFCVADALDEDVPENHCMIVPSANFL